MRTIASLLFCYVLVACQSVHNTPAESFRDAQVLSSIHSIYVDDLAHEEGANLVEETTSVRNHICDELAKSGRFFVVQDPAQADAILDGLVGVERWYHGMEGYYGMEGDLDTHELGVGKVRLIDSKTKQTIWKHEYETGFLSPKQSVAERVADQVVDRLLIDATRTDNSPDRIPQPAFR